MISINAHKLIKNAAHKVRHRSLFVLIYEIFAGLVHFAKAEHLLAVPGNVLLCLNAGELLALGAEVNVLFLAALSYLAALAELIVVGGYCAAAVTDDILGIEYRSPHGILMGKVFSHGLVVPLGGYVNGTLAAHHSAA